MAFALSLIAGYGVFLIYTSTMLGWRGLRISPLMSRTTTRRHSFTLQLNEWLTQAGLNGIPAAEFAGVVVFLFVLGAGTTFAIFGGILPAIVVGCFLSGFPLASYRARRLRRLIRAREGWPGMLEELRLLTCSLGRSIPQALFEIGHKAPAELRGAFAASEREWLISTDFARTIHVLKGRLADPAADMICETLLVAHAVGGNGLANRLDALIEDRTIDLQARKDAVAKQAGVRFARRFVLAVPCGMAVVGMSIGTGRSAYASAAGQIAVVMAIAVVIACWIWAGKLLRLPEDKRVLAQ